MSTAIKTRATPGNCATHATPGREARRRHAQMRIARAASIVSAAPWRRRSPAPRAAGFTLVELLVVVVILSLILGIGVPSYRQYVMRANRADATAALLRLAAAQERFYIANGSYATEAQRAVAPPAGLGFGTTERGYYALNLTNPDGPALSFTATATVLGDERQADDTTCRTFSINERGQRAAVDAGGNDTTEDCWR